MISLHDEVYKAIAPLWSYNIPCDSNRFYISFYSKFIIKYGY